MENLVLGDVLSLGHLSEPALHIQHTLVGAVSSGCCSSVSIESQDLSRKNFWISSLLALSECCKSDGGRWLSQQIFTAGMSMERNSWGSSIPSHKAGLNSERFLQTCLASWWLYHSEVASWTSSTCRVST